MEKEKSRPSTKSVKDKQLERQEKAVQAMCDSRRFDWSDDVYVQIEELASIGCTQEEISRIIGCSPRALVRRKAAEISEDGDFSRLCLALSRGKARANLSIRRALFNKIRTGNSTCIVFACKTILGLTEHREVTHTITADISGLSDAELVQQAAKIIKLEGKEYSGPARRHKDIPSNKGKK